MSSTQSTSHSRSLRLVSAAIATILSCSPTSSVLALTSQSVTTNTRTSKAIPSYQSLDELLLLQRQRQQQTSQGPSLSHKYNDVYDYDDDDDDEDEDDDWFFSSHTEDVQPDMRRFRELRASTGSEILQAELQAQIDEAVAEDETSFNANNFLDLHVQDATALEKLAMSSVTSQLPERAVKALSQEKGKRNKHTGKGVGADEEIVLARLIQRGASLFRLRGRLQSELGRNPTRQEWADRAKVTPKELRRHVANYRLAKHKLVEANMGLVHAVVNQQFYGYKSFYKTSSSGSNKAELVQEGSLGLLRAAELFDPSRGLRFSTYAVVWIKGTLANSHLTEFVRLPQREKTKYNKILKAQRDIIDSESVSAASTSSPEEVAALTGLSVEDVLATQQRMEQARRLLSLDYEYAAQSRSGAETSSLNNMEKHPALQADADLAERTQLRADVLAALASNLDSREARLMRLRYGLSDGHARSLHECAEAMGLSYTRVHQLATKCLEKLRRAAEIEGLEEYLLTIA